MLTKRLFNQILNYTVIILSVSFKVARLLLVIIGWLALRMIAGGSLLWSDNAHYKLASLRTIWADLVS